MPIVPAEEYAYRLKIRRRLTLDLLTRHGMFWTYIDAMRDQWDIEPIVAVPPEPDFHVEAVGLMTRWQMPERIHMPKHIAMPSPNADELLSVAAEHDIEGMSGIVQSIKNMERPLNVGLFLKAIQDVWKVEVARPHELGGDWRNGGNVGGWMTWAPFLSACVLYDPPAERLLDYADHDDHNAAALPQRTFLQDGDYREQAGVHKYRFKTGELAAIRQYGDALRDSFIESDVSTPPFRTRGQPKRDDLDAVQCAIWRELGMSSADIGRRIDRSVRDNTTISKPGKNPPKRERSDAAEDAIKHGREILTDRNAWARIIAE